MLKIDHLVGGKHKNRWIYITELIGYANREGSFDIYAFWK